MINLTNGMLLYHGSYAEVPNIELEKCKTGKDFGRGFYVTSSYSQAQRFIPNSILRQKKVSHTSQRSNCGFVSVYRFDMGGSLKIHCFHNAGREWLHFAAANRKKELFPDLIALFSEFDIIGGKIANDRTAQTLLLYIGGAYGQITSEMADRIAIQTLLPNRLEDQFCFRSSRAIASLKFIRSDRYEHQS